MDGTLLRNRALCATLLQATCFKIGGESHILSAANMYPTACGFWRYKAYVDIRRGSLVKWSNESAVVENASFLLRSLYLYEVAHWLYLSKFTRLRAVTLR